MTRRMIGRGATLALALLLSGMNPAIAQTPPFWGGPAPGPHDVGFRSEWLFDAGRTYRATFDDGSTYGDGKAPRPILVNLWYPALRDLSAPRMRHVEYLDVETDDPGLATFAAALRRFNLDVIVREVTGAGFEDLDETAIARYEATLAAPTAARRGAPAAAGRFPVVIYHAGHGSSYEDNVVLCEVLASHGYIVIGSAFQYGDGSGLATDTDAGSIADLDALIRFAGGLENADWSRIALVGHSGGAQLGFRYVARPGSAVDAFVSLDTTQDYYGLSATYWSYPEEVLENRDYVTAPILVAANPHAVFLLADSLGSADRYYLTIRGVAHNEFISQGLMASDFAARADTGGGDAPVPSAAVEEYRGDPEVMERYEALVASVRRFLDGQLKGDAAALTALREDFGSTTIGGTAPHVAHVPPGTTSAPPYSDAASAPPAPRQLRPLIERLGVEESIAILERWRDATAPSPILDEPTFATALLWEYVLADRIDEATRLYRFFDGVHENMIGQFLRWYDVFSSIGDDVTAREWLSIAEALDPTNPDVRARSGGSPGPGAV